MSINGRPRPVAQLGVKIKSKLTQEHRLEGTLCGCMSYRNAAGASKCCPYFCPLACLFPCCVIGRIKTLLDYEKEMCCGMGNQGWAFCVLTSFAGPFAICGAAVSLRYEAVTSYKVTEDYTCCKGCCAPCSLFQIYMSLLEWQNKNAEEIENAVRVSDQIAGAGSREINDKNAATELVLQSYASSGLIDPSTIPDHEIDTPMAAPQPSAPPSTIKVTIPATYFAGDTFPYTLPDGRIISVLVPPGGRPGLKMEIVV